MQEKGLSASTIKTDLAAIRFFHDMIGNAKYTLPSNAELGVELERRRFGDTDRILENMPMPQFSLGSPQAVLDFVKAINDAHFKICLDTGHVAIFPDLTPANVLRQMGTEVHAFHIHDNDGIRDLHKVPYDGVIDWEDFGRALKETKCKAVFPMKQHHLLISHLQMRRKSTQI